MKWITLVSIYLFIFLFASCVPSKQAPVRSEVAVDVQSPELSDSIEEDENLDVEGSTDLEEDILDATEDLHARKAKVYSIQELIQTEIKPTSKMLIDKAIQVANQADVSNDPQRFEEAIQALTEILEQDPNAFLAAYNLGVLYDQTHQPDLARQFYQKALEIEGEFSPALLNWVRLEIREDHLQDAQNLAQKYIDDHPQNVDHKLTALEVLLAKEDYEGLIRQARTILKINEANARAPYYMAYAHYRMKRYPLAAFILKDAIERDPNDPEFYFLRGLILMAMEKETQANEAFAKAVQLRPDYPEAQNAYGLALYRSRQFDQARQAFEVAIRYRSNFKEAYLNLGNAIKAQAISEIDVDAGIFSADGREALAAYQKAVALDPQWPDPYLAIGALYLDFDIVEMEGYTSENKSQLERVKKAKEYFDKAKELWGNSKDVALADQFIAKAESEIVDLEDSIAFAEMEEEDNEDFDASEDLGEEDLTDHTNLESNSDLEEDLSEVQDLLEEDKIDQEDQDEVLQSAEEVVEPVSDLEDLSPDEIEETSP